MQLPSKQTLDRMTPAILAVLLHLINTGRHQVAIPARLALKHMILVFMRMVIDAKKAGRDDVWQWAADLMEEFGRRRTLLWADQLNVDTNDLADMVRIQDIEDYVFGVTGHWEERGPHKAVKLETECPFADLATEMPQVCSDLVHRFEVASYRSLNESYTLSSLDDLPLLCKGDDRCRFEHSIQPSNGIQT